MVAKLTNPGYGRLVSCLLSPGFINTRAARGKGVTSLPRPADRSNPFVRDDDRGREETQERKKGTNSESFSGTKISLLSCLAAASKMARAP